MRLVTVSLCILPLIGSGFEYREALPGYSYQFPRDHFEHEDFRTEWWYYTGNVTGKTGERFGFELVFFREGARHDPAGKSAWTVQNLYLAHAALTDAKGKRFSYEERLNRSGPGLAGASFDRRRVWNGNWSARWDGENQTLDAVTEHFRFHLQLDPEKPFVIRGRERGQPEGGRAGQGVILRFLPPDEGFRHDQLNSPVTGRAWMDHEWFTEQLAPDQVGWDWFSVQLDNHTELMLFELRQKDGSIDPYSSGTFVDARGVARHLRHEDFSLQPLSYWQKYPVEWRLQRAIAEPRHHLHIRSCGSESPAINYWEGAVDYSGSQTGVGYLEMTGYEGPVKF